MSEDAIISKAVAADRIVSEYSAEVKSFENGMRTEINNMHSILNGLFSAWSGELADLYRGKIENNLAELDDTCERAKKLSDVLEKRAELMHSALDKLKKAGTT